eukprot:scaffold432223_cov32-Prasinocladus_malaysianus.AAC.1
MNWLTLHPQFHRGNTKHLFRKCNDVSIVNVILCTIVLACYICGPVGEGGAAEVPPGRRAHVQHDPGPGEDLQQAEGPLQALRPPGESVSQSVIAHIRPWMTGHT